MKLNSNTYCTKNTNTKFELKLLPMTIELITNFWAFWAKYNYLFSFFVKNKTLVITYKPILFYFNSFFFFFVKMRFGFSCFRPKTYSNYNRAQIKIIGPKIVEKIRPSNQIGFILEILVLNMNGLLHQSFAKIPLNQITKDIISNKSSQT